jgi:aldehyde:ferredoxin oxidoreductase
MAETILKGDESCYACAVRCKRAVRVSSGPYATSEKYGGPEYETLGSLGSLLCIDELEAISKGNELCNRYTLDTISTGVAIGFPMECFEAGLIGRDDTEGIDFRFGNPEAMLKGIEWIAYRKPGLGDLLADGVKIAAAKIGGGSEAFALHIKGQELPMHDPRGKIGVGLSYALSPTGADHVRAPTTPPFRPQAPTWSGSPRWGSSNRSRPGRRDRARPVTSPTSSSSGRFTNLWGCATSWPDRSGP